MDQVCSYQTLQIPHARLKLVLSDGVDGSTRTASQCAMLVLFATNREKEPSTMDITTLGIDLAKSVFQLHGIDTNGVVVLQKKLRRGAVLNFLSKLEPCLMSLPQRSGPPL